MSYNLVAFERGIEGGKDASLEYEGVRAIAGDDAGAGRKFEPEGCVGSAGDIGSADTSDSGTGSGGESGRLSASVSRQGFPPTHPGSGTAAGGETV